MQTEPNLYNLHGLRLHLHTGSNGHRQVSLTEWRPLIGPDPSRYCALIGCLWLPWAVSLWHMNWWLPRRKRIQIYYGYCRPNIMILSRNYTRFFSTLPSWRSSLNMNLRSEARLVSTSPPFIQLRFPLRLRSKHVGVRDWNEVMILTSSVC